MDFFIHCESNGISSAVRLYIIKGGKTALVSHHTFSVLNEINIIAICFYIIMFFFAKRVFDKISLTTKNKKFLIIGWGAWLIFRIVSYVLITNRMIDSLPDILPYIFMNLIIYIGTALLITFTARIVNFNHPTKAAVLQSPRKK